ncbi:MULTISPECIES: methyl-accepting chemotaxis protein [unclassified Duganella]|uniref:methyl-accepting chemotaxis protein n=1 Tax=unclassified Duganella TaxID=2636909 RepID=UPI0008868467|nr:MULTISPECIES: methyl-accepting chemotaxis protein [unclassified Duganella]SDF70438.1 methyl-accepting chemotaxis protein [Duganella sp. OV458]SDI58865.1 methyl-accepting chemotaxis protein [Duganella sp. OV510]
MLSKLRIGPKLLLAPGVVLILLIALSAGAYLGLLRQNQSLDNMVQQRAVRLKAAADLVASAHQAHTQIYQLLTWVNGSFSASRVDALVREINLHHAALDRQFAQLEIATQGDPAERRFVAQSQAAHAVYVKAVREVIELAMADQSIAANAMAKAGRAFDVVEQRLQELSRLEQSLSERAYADAETDFRVLSTWMPIVVALSIALSLLVSMAVRNAMLKEVREIGAAALDLAEGNLTVRQRVYGKDEIAETSRALDTSIRNLNTTLKTILATAHSIDSASREIAHGNALLARRGHAQVGTLGSAGSTMQQISTRVSQLASDAELAGELAHCTNSFAARSGSVVQRLVVTMASLRGSSRRVVEVAGIIDGLAVQTHMLALSASMEAARAGEHGQRFAIVAGEVRTLAQRSASAALDIKAAVADAVADIDYGTRSVEEAGASMAEIADSARQVGKLLEQIGNGNVQQAQDVQEVQQAVVSMDQVTQQNLALVQQAAAAASSLQRQALYLSEAVATFKLDEGAEPPDNTRPAGSQRVVRLRLASVRN